MSRARVYETAADRQRAYRDRQRPGPSDKVEKPTGATSAKSRGPSRVQRLAAIEAGLRQLVTEYEQWRDAMPANLAESTLAGQLTQVVSQLETMADDLQELDLPRGFGR